MKGTKSHHQHYCVKERKHTGKINKKKHLLSVTADIRHHQLYKTTQLSGIVLYKSKHRRYLYYRSSIFHPAYGKGNSMSFFSVCIQLNCPKLSVTVILFFPSCFPLCSRDCFVLGSRSRAIWCCGTKTLQRCTVRLLMDSSMFLVSEVTFSFGWCCPCSSCFIFCNGSNTSLYFPN